MTPAIGTEEEGAILQILPPTRPFVGGDF